MHSSQSTTQFQGIHCLPVAFKLRGVYNLMIRQALLSSNELKTDLYMYVFLLELRIHARYDDKALKKLITLACFASPNQLVASRYN